MNITFKEDLTGTKPSIKEIEKSFKALASAKGEYEFVKSGENKAISRKKIAKNPRFKSNAEQGSWGGMEIAKNAIISIGVRWDLSHWPNYCDVEVGGSVSHFLWGGGESTSSGHSTVGGGNPYTISFDCYLTYTCDDGWFSFEDSFSAYGQVHTGSGLGGFTVD